MRRTLFFFLLFVIGSAGCNSKEKVSDPEDIGQQAMSILERMNDLTRPEFAEHFISWNDLNTLLPEKVQNDEEAKRAMFFPTKQEMKTRYNFMHRRLKALGKRFGINWDKISFVAFRHKTEKLGDLTFCYGQLTFKYRSTNFSIETTSMYDGSHYFLSGLSGLREES